MPSTEKLDSHQKALTLNLNPSTFGSFAEIGAGQEVARWFLVVGGASGTVRAMFPGNGLKPCWKTNGFSCLPS